MKDNLPAENGENRLYILVGALALSLVFHAAMMAGLSDCKFNPVSPVEMQHTRKWSRDVQTMKVESVKGDPFVAAAEALGTPAAPPVVEDEYRRVERLAEEIPANAAPPRPPDEAARLAADPTADAPQPKAPALRPREEIAVVDNPTVPDDAAALPRIVIPAVPRMKGAPDISPPAELLKQTAAAKVEAAKPASDALSDPGLNAPVPPMARPVAGGFSGLSARAEADVGKSAFELGKGAVARKAKDKARRSAEAAKKEREEEKREEEAMARRAASAQAASAPEIRVDERLVKKAREAVRELRDETMEEGAPFEGNVKCELDWWIDPAHPQFKYFRAAISSREENPLPVVPKDMVYLIDVSASIGQDRLRSCRNFVEEHIRALNPGDRFNIAAFRNKTLYLFKGWRSPDKASLGKAAAWLGALSAHGSTDVFESLKSVLALPRSPSRPVVALVITDGEATSGTTRSAEIISRFAELNDGLVSVYMYGVKEKANAYLMDMLARGNRGDWARHDGFRWRAASGLPDLTAKFASPVLTDISVVFSTASRAQAYPSRVTNLYKSQPLEIWGLCPAEQKEILFRMRGLNAEKVYESMFRIKFGPTSTIGPETKDEWARRRLYAQVEDYTINPSERLMRDLRLFSESYKVPIPYEEEIR